MKKTILLMFLAGITTVGYSQFLKAGSVIGGWSFQFLYSKSIKTQTPKEVRSH